MNSFGFLGWWPNGRRGPPPCKNQSAEMMPIPTRRSLVGGRLAPAPGPRRRVLAVALWLLLGGRACVGQTTGGQIRLRVIDGAGHGLTATVMLATQGWQKAGMTDATGLFVAHGLPLGDYTLSVVAQGFHPSQSRLSLHTTVPIDRVVALQVAMVSTRVEVAARRPESAGLGAPSLLSATTLREAPLASPGRTLVDAVAAQPGWLLEGNGVLHPRGAEYGTQFVVDGIPLDENRSPAFAPPLGDVSADSVTVLTAAYPAEYGRKLDGVVAVASSVVTHPGVHGSTDLAVGGFGTRHVAGNGQWQRGPLTLLAAVQGGWTQRYLDPPVIENYSNQGADRDLQLGAAREFTRGYARAAYRAGAADFEIPNQREQESAGQRQHASNRERAVSLEAQWLLTAQLLAATHFSLRSLGSSFGSNAASTPLDLGQERRRREGYVQGSLAGHWGKQDLQAGADFLWGQVREVFRFQVTDPTALAASVPSHFQFQDRADDREPGVYLEDHWQPGSWTLSAGMRYDDYHLKVSAHAFSPRLALTRAWPALGLALHGSYDRVFETPAVENLLLASSAEAERLSPGASQLPVPPSRGNFWQFGLSQTAGRHVRLEADLFRRDLRHFADDDPLLGTAITLPTTFSQARIRGLEASLEVPGWGAWSAGVNYSYQLGVARLPLTGGLFLQPAEVLQQSGVWLPISQDQRQSGRARLRRQLGTASWVSLAARFNSGLPVELNDADPVALAAAYGPAVLQRVNLVRGRVRPQLTLDASLGRQLWERRGTTGRLQLDVRNLTDRVDLINFAGLLSGTALGMPRRADVRLRVAF